MGPLLDWLKPQGKLVVVGAAFDPMEISIPQIITSSKMIQGEASGTAMDISDTLKFSRLQQVRPMIEVMPLEKVSEAYAKMMKNDARFRRVLKI